MLVLETSGRNLISRRALAIVGSALLVPVSVISVNWIGWRTTTLSPGFGLHANLRYEGDVLREYSAIMAGAPDRPAFADPDRPRLRWWNIYVGPEVTRAEYEAFDDSAAPTCGSARGLPCATSGPACDSRQRCQPSNGSPRGRIRLEPLEPPWSTLVRWLDIATWILLAVGLAFPETRLLCAFALVLWIVPALGNIVSPYEPRYHLPMSA